MKRLIATIRCDIQLQARHGFYYVSAIVVLIWTALLVWFPLDGLAWIFPAFVINHLVIGAFYFMGGLVLLEKGEGTIQAQAVTPLRTAEYLASKLFTLTFLALLETLLLVVLVYGFRTQLLWLVMGVAEAAVFFCLAGFLVVIHYPSLNEYLLPSFLFVSLLIFPLLSYAGLGESWLFYLHPLQAAIILLQAAFRETAVWQIAYGVFYGLAWIGVLFALSQSAFRQYMETNSY